MKKSIITCFVIFTSIFRLMAQDTEGCKDHPMFSRMPGFVISECTQNYDQLDLYNASGEDIKAEGNLTHIWYVFNLESGAKEPSYFQILKNYANAILKTGGRKIFEDNQNGCYEVKSDGKEYKVKVRCTNNSDIVLDVLEMVPMVQDITANVMLESLNKDGYIALNILFETGKSTIQKESLVIVDQIFEMLKTSPELKISIEGHTDNVGTAAANKKLSQERAKAVMDALVAKGIDKSRMSFLGWGQEKPVAGNDTPDGRAKNRRVEIVKK